MTIFRRKPRWNLIQIWSGRRRSRQRKMHLGITGSVTTQTRETVFSCAAGGIIQALARPELNLVWLERRERLRHAACRPATKPTQVDGHRMKPPRGPLRRAGHWRSRPTVTRIKLWTAMLGGWKLIMGKSHQGNDKQARSDQASVPPQTHEQPITKRPLRWWGFDLVHASVHT